MTEDELKAIETRAILADKSICEVAANPKKFLMSIPPQSGDTDILVVQLAREDVPALLAEVRRLKRIIARELSEGDEIGAEYTYVNALKDENARLREALKEIAAKGEMTLICQPGSFGDSEEAYSTGAHSAFAQSAEIAQEALEAK